MGAEFLTASGGEADFPLAGCHPSFPEMHRSEVPHEPTGVCDPEPHTEVAGCGASGAGALHQAWSGVLPAAVTNPRRRSHLPGATKWSGQSPDFEVPLRVLRQLDRTPPPGSPWPLALTGVEVAIMPPVQGGQGQLAQAHEARSTR